MQLVYALILFCLWAIFYVFRVSAGLFLHLLVDCMLIAAILLVISHFIEARKARQESTER